MTAATIEPVNHVPGNVLARAFGPVPNGQEWSVAVRISSAADDSFNLQLRKTDGSNAGYRAQGHPVPAGAGTYDIEERLVLPAGYELWDSSKNGLLSASYTGTLRMTS